MRPIGRHISRRTELTRYLGVAIEAGGITGEVRINHVSEGEEEIERFFVDCRKNGIALTLITTDITAKIATPGKAECLWLRRNRGRAESSFFARAAGKGGSVAV